jgi:hypothetical protein
VERVYKEENWKMYTQMEMEPRFREDLSPEAEEEPLSEAVTRQLLSKTLQTGKT